LIRKEVIFLDNKSNNENDFIFYILKTILLFSISVAGCLICLMIGFCSLQAHAEYAVGTSYIAHWAYSDSQFSTERTFEGEFELGNDHPTALICHGHNGMYQLCEYVEEEETAYYMSFTGNHTGHPLEGHYTVLDKNDKTITNLEFPAVETSPTLNAILSKFYSVSPLDSLVVTSNMYVFDSLESATAYYRDGDGSGIISRPPPDYDYDHDFREDPYDPDIPVPELSNFSYNGFHVNNADPSRDIDIYIETTFYGLKHKTPDESSLLRDSDYYEADKSWAFRSRRYNLINSDISYSDENIDILKMYRADIVRDLTIDFKEWSEEYPSHKKLPDYSFWTNNSATHANFYNKNHIYNSSGGTDETKLKATGQASVIYHVRFCQYVPNSGYTYGKWISYVYTGRTGNVKDDVNVGDTTPDPDTGKPTITDPRPGKQDPDTGDVDYDGTSNMDSSDLWATIKNLVNNMGAIPEIIGEVLSFLPPWVLYMIAAGIAACVILRFVGR